VLSGSTIKKEEILNYKTYTDCALKERMIKNGSMALSFIENLHNRKPKFFTRHIDDLESFRTESTGIEKSKSAPDEASSLSDKFARPIVLRHSHDSMSFKKLHLHGVPYLLTEDLGKKQKEHARAALLFLHAVERDSRHYCVTGNQSWFFFNMSPRRVCTLSRGNLVTEPRFDMESK
jgi:hypothetical protein